jgi:hypothetical protein
MDDDALVRAFEGCELASFRHADHVRVAWVYLQREPLLPALTRFTAAIRRFAAAKGAPERYHETITVAYLLLIAERIRQEPGLSWPEFAARNTDLLIWKPSVLSRYYTEKTLSSVRAREAFVLPDR